MRKLVWAQRIPSGRKMVLLAVADASDRDGMCFLSLAELSEMVGMAQDDAHSHLHNLVRSGFVEAAAEPALCRVIRDRLRGGAR